MEPKEILLELRTRRGISQAQLAEQVHVTRQAVSRWETGVFHKRVCGRQCQLSMLYDADPAHVEEQRRKGIVEADKLIANKVLEAIRVMLRKDRETGSFEYAEARKAYYTERLICEILMALEQNAVNMGMEYDDCQKAMGGDLSKAAKKEWYLRHKDRGMEP